MQHRRSGSGMKRRLAYQSMLKRKSANKLFGFWRSPTKRPVFRKLSIDYAHR